MPIPTPNLLENSDIRPELREHITAIADHLATNARYLGLPRTDAQILVRRLPGASEVGVHLLGPRAWLLRKPMVPHRAVVVRLAAGAARELAGIPVHALAGRALPLADVWGDEQLVDELAASNESRYGTIVQAALVRRLSKTERSDRRAITVAGALLDAHPELRIAAVADRVGLSDRHLRRRFEDAIGLTPKSYARVVRVRRALALARFRSRWADIALAAGYYDQAHMISEFRASTGTTPVDLVVELADAL